MRHHSGRGRTNTHQYLKKKPEENQFLLFDNDEIMIRNWTLLYCASLLYVEITRCTCQYIFQQLMIASLWLVNHSMASEPIYSEWKFFVCFHGYYRIWHAKGKRNTVLPFGAIFWSLLPARLSEENLHDNHEVFVDNIRSYYKHTLTSLTAFSRVSRGTGTWISINIIKTWSPM